MINSRVIELLIDDKTRYNQNNRYIVISFNFHFIILLDLYIVFRVYLVEYTGRVYTNSCSFLTYYLK